MNEYLVTTLFLDNTKSVPKSVAKTYDYIISDSLFSKIEVGPSAGSDKTTIYLTSYNIQNTDGYDYRGSKVVFLMAKPYKPEKGDNLIAFKRILKITNKEEIVCLTSHYNKQLLPIIKEKSKNGWYISKTNLYWEILFNAVGNDMVTNGITTDKLGSSNCCCTSSTSNAVSGSWSNTGTSTGGVLRCGDSWITTTPYTTSDWTVTLGNYPTQSEIDEIKKRLDKIENKDKKENKKMFENLTKNLKCGRAQDVRMSIYGPAFKSEDGNWYAVDSEDVLIDVSDLLFDMDSYCYMMPVAKNQINIGDFILHNGRWVKVLTTEDNTINGALDFFKKEFIVPMPTKSPFGFEFYTKLIPLLDFTKMQANTDTPFGAIPMLMMMNNKNDKDILPMLMMMGTQGGFNFDMSNPMMMYFLMKDGNDNNLLPFLMMGQMNKSNK